MNRHAPRRSGRDYRIGFAVLCLLCLQLCSSPSVHAAGPLPKEELKQHSRDQIQSLQDEKSKRTPAQRKLDSQLVLTGRRFRGEDLGKGLEKLRPSVRRHTDGRLLVDVEAEVTPALLAQITGNGGTVVNSFPRYRAIRAWIPTGSIELIAALPDVRRIRPASEAASSSGSIVSEGDLTHRADEARQAFRVGGEGIKVGVLSDGVSHLNESQFTGDLPNVTILPGQSGDPNGAEGTAMLEIVHDLAPQAQLFFATAFNGEASFAQNIRDLQAAGCRIIVDDVSYFSESPFQDDTISQAINEVSAAGALIFSAAGNSGNKRDGTASVWEGDFVDGGAANLGRGGRLHDFGGATANGFVAGGGFRRVDLFWADPLGKSANDYDVFVLDAQGNVIASSTNIQDGNDDPYEGIGNLTTGDRVVIVKVSGSARFLHLSTGRGRLAITTPGRIAGHNGNGAPNMFSVAATWVRSPALPFVGGSDDPVETFTSDGPRRVFFNPDGTAITPGNFSSTGGFLRHKPDITAADGGATSVPGFEQFFGTSAAAPHAAAVAALVWAYNPSLSASQVRDALTRSALDIEGAGTDDNSGAGIVMAPPAITAAPAPAPRAVYLGSVLTGGNGNSTLDRDECNQLFLQLQNVIGPNGQKATGVKATLRSLTPGLVVDPAPISFPDIPPMAAVSNAQPFQISTLSTFTCGVSGILEVLIQSSSGSVTQQFELPSTTPDVGPAIAFRSTDVPKTVPDLGQIESSVTVSGLDLAIAHVTVELNVQHPYDSDLILTLVGPDGTSVDLANRDGDGGHNFGINCQTPTVFDDDSTNRLVFGVAPFAGSYQPQQPLAAFRGKVDQAANGVWRLIARDVAEPDSGTLQCWTLHLAPFACPSGNGACFTPPSFTQQPDPTVVTNGTAASFNVVVSGTLPLTYQWFYNSTNALPNQTNASLVLTSVSATQAGLYSVIASNKYGNVRSREVALTVLVPSTIAQQPQSLTVLEGAPASFSVVAVGSSPLTFQWFRGAKTLIPGATGPDFQIAATTTNDAASYSVVVSNPYATVTSSPAVLKVGIPPTFLEQPTSLSALPGTTVSFSVVARGSTPLTYQWYFNETTPIAGATTATLTLPQISKAQAGGYHVVVSNPYGQASSQEGVLTVETPNALPSVVLTSPANASSIASTNLPLLLTATASDPDGTVRSVAFVADGQPIAVSSSAPYAFTWPDPSVGVHSLQAIATDDLGGRGTSAVVRVTLNFPANGLTPLIPVGAIWRYLDDGSDQGSVWTELGFNDSSWSSGPAELGYGDTTDGRPEATVIQFGPSASNKYLTYYFRHEFVITDPRSFSNLQARLLRDDGAVVYINGVEGFRSNMPQGPITYRTTASAAVNGNAETTFQTTNLPASLLRLGTNVVAVEVHQSSTNSTDISFDLELSGTRHFDPIVLTPPHDLTLNAGDDGELSVTAAGGTPLAYQWYRNRTNRLANATNALLPFVNATTNLSGNYSVIITNVYGRTTSSVASVTVVPVFSNAPPTVAISSPAAGASFRYDQLPVAISIAAADPDQNLATVGLFANGKLLTSFTQPPYVFEWSDPTPGFQRLQAIATDEAGLSATSAVTRIEIAATALGEVPLLATGSVWRYEDKGTDLGTSWTGLNYSDASWASGPAELGYGDSADGRPEATVISFGLLSALKHPTAYFRRSFFLTAPASFNAIRFSLLRDDGAVVYLNGVEQFRDNLPAGTITFDTLAVAAINGAAETNLVVHEVPGSVLLPGWNQLAVEIHQSSRASSDLSFDLSLIGLRTQPPQITRQPQSQSATNGATVNFSLTASGPPPLSYHWFFEGNPVSASSTNATLTLTAITRNSAGRYQCEVSNGFGLVLSSNALLTVTDQNANLPPLISLATPADGSQFAVGTTPRIEATASDPDGQVVSVRFFADGALIGSNTSPPYQADWTQATPGAHSLWATAMDNLGLLSTSAVTHVTVLVPNTISRTLVSTGSVWRYLDNGVDQRTTWRRRVYDDSTWSTGRALLGYGNAAKGRPEVTVLNFGPSALLKYPTYYFRQSFVLSNVTQVSRLVLRAVRDDGIAVFLNGTRVWKDNLPAGDPTFATLAVTSITGTNETTYFGNQPDPTLLVEGTNTLAVEVHQASRVSDDLAFDLSLTAEITPPPVIVTQPSDLTVTNGTPATFTVVAFGNGTLSYQWYFNETNLVPSATQSSLTLANPVAKDAGLYSVVVQGTGGSTRSRGARLTVITPPPNQPPVVAITSPTNNASFVQGGLVTLSATASDPDGTIAHVEFYDASNLLIRLTNAPYLYDWAGATSGVHTLRAAATDNRGGTNLSAPITITLTPPPPPPSLFTTLVSTGSVWKYLDTGTNAGTAWRTPGFNDQSWSSGAAELGYGDSVEGRPETTLLQFGPSTANKYITYYFRQNFAVTDPASFSNLTVRLLRDDGGLVYLNGKEIFRSNMPTGAVDYLTLASSAVNKQFETTFYETNLDARGLVAGANLLAVEIHQAAANSSDISFDLELLGARPGIPVILAQPEPQTVAPGRAAQFAVVAGGAPPLVYQWYRNGLTPIAGGTNANLVLLNVQSADAGSYSVVVTNGFGSAKSAPAVLSLTGPLAITSEPVGITVTAGSPIRLSVAANGTAPLSYQWMFNTNTVLAGATSAELVIPSASIANMGFYSVKVSNSSGSVMSQQAEVRVLTRPTLVSIEFLTNDVTVTFATVSRLRYTVEATDLLVPANWTSVAGAVQLKGTGGAVSVHDPVPAAKNRFYRIRVE